MPAFAEYTHYRRVNRSIAGSLAVAAADGDATLASVRSTQHTLYIQKIVAWINTDAAQSWSFEDSNGTAKVIALVTTSPGAATRWEFDFTERGVPLTQGKNFVLNVSAAGLAGHIEWLGYERLTGIEVGNAAPSAPHSA